MESHCVVARLTFLNVDIIFSKCTSEFDQKIDFEQFMGSLVAIAEIRGCAPKVLIALMLEIFANQCVQARLPGKQRPLKGHPRLMNICS